MIQLQMVTEIQKGCSLIGVSISKDKGQHVASVQTLSDCTQSQSCAERDSWPVRAWY